MEPIAADRERDAEDIRDSLRDPPAFSIIFERHVPNVARFVARRVKPGDVEDLVAETFIAAFRARGSYDLKRPYALPWLYGIATNIVRHHFRSEERRRRILLRWQQRAGRDLDITDGGLLAADAWLEAEEISAQLVVALESLDAGSREALLLFACEDFSYEEVAQSLRIPMECAKSSPKSLVEGAP